MLLQFNHLMVNVRKERTRDAEKAAVAFRKKSAMSHSIIEASSQLTGPLGKISVRRTGTNYNFQQHQFAPGVKQHSPVGGACM